MMLRIIVGMLCCVMQAATPAEVPLEVMNPIFERPSSTITEYTREQWCEKMQTYLKKDGEVRVFYFSKEEERHSVTYDIKSSNVSISFSYKNESDDAIVPLQYALQQEILKGYILKAGRSFSAITGTGFSQKDVSCADYFRKQFFSAALDYFLTECFPKFAEQGKERFDRDGKALTADMLKAALPPSRYKRFFWKVLCEDEALDVLQKGKNQHEVLLIIGDIGVLWGARKICMFSDVVSADERSLFGYKLAKIRGSMCAKYPFVKEERRFCLNYAHSQEVDGWQKHIRKSLEQKNQVEVFYCSEEDECYSAGYDLSSSTIEQRGVWEGEAGMLILPLLYFVQQEFLQGYVLKSGFRAPIITDANFSEKDVCLDHYDQQQFCSRRLDYVLRRSLQQSRHILTACYTKGQTQSKTLRERLDDIVKKVVPKKDDGRQFLWNVVHEKRAVGILIDRHKESEVLVVVSGVGVLHGRVVDSLSEDVPEENHRSLYHYKMRGDLRSICAQYPFIYTEAENPSDGGAKVQ